MNGCGTNCFLSIHIKKCPKCPISKWIPNTVITKIGKYCRNIVEMGTLALETVSQEIELSTSEDRLGG